MYVSFTVGVDDEQKSEEKEKRTHSMYEYVKNKKWSQEYGMSLVQIFLGLIDFFVLL